MFNCSAVKSTFSWIFLKKNLRTNQEILYIFSFYCNNGAKSCTFTIIPDKNVIYKIPKPKYFNRMDND